MKRNRTTEKERKRDDADRTVGKGGREQ